MDNFQKARFLLRRKASKTGKTRNSYAYYNLFLATAIALPLTAVGLFNWAIDPQDMFDTPNYWQLNHNKIKKDNNDRLYKATDIIRLQPTAIVVGSSRTKQGIDPTSKWLGRSNFYNLALNGPNFYELKRYIEHAIYNQPDLDRIVLGLDFFMFNQDLENQPTFSESRLGTSWYAPQDLVTNLFSLDSTARSWETIKASGKAPEDDYGENGFMPNRNANNGEAIWRFHQSIKLYYSLHSNYQLSPSYWNDLEEIIELCKENNITLDIFISPAHATQWESIQTTNKWAVFEQWKRDLVELTPVWDFSGYNSITTEPIAKYMDNYVDSSHYSPEIGELVLQKMLGKSQDQLPDDFGVLLTSENINAHLQQIREERQQWLQAHPEEAAMVRDFYDATLSKNSDG